MSTGIIAEMQVVNFAPQSLQIEVVQNVRTLLATRAGSVPMDRDFGLSWATLDGPVNMVRARINAEVVRKIQRYEPRARVISVTYEGSEAMAGVVRPKVYIEVIE